LRFSCFQSPKEKTKGGRSSTEFVYDYGCDYDYDCGCDCGCDCQYDSEYDGEYDHDFYYEPLGVMADNQLYQHQGPLTIARLSRTMHWLIASFAFHVSPPIPVVVLSLALALAFDGFVALVAVTGSTNGLVCRLFCWEQATFAVFHVFMFSCLGGPAVYSCIFFI